MNLDGWLDFLLRAGGAGLAISAILLVVGWMATRGSELDVSRSFIRNLSMPLLCAGPLLAARMMLPVVRGLEADTFELVHHVLVLLMIGVTGWIIVALVAFLDAYLHDRFPVGVADNLEARRIHTRFQVLRRLVSAVTFLVCGAAALTTFPGMRALGTGLLASAGIIGIVLGIAARPTVEAFIAGVQLAWTQPFRLDDVVIIEDEWGRIEAIEATYVVVRLWDLRRLVVPLSYMLTHPFQNWTRTSAELLGAVTVEVDYRTPVEVVRRHVGAILAETPRFEGGFWNLQVVDAGPQTLRLRVLVAAPNADVAWELRCEVREKLIAFLQSAYPDCLPRLRAELGALAADPEPLAPA